MRSYIFFYSRKLLNVVNNVCGVSYGYVGKIQLASTRIWILVFVAGWPNLVISLYYIYLLSYSSLSSLSHIILRVPPLCYINGNSFNITNEYSLVILFKFSASTTPKLFCCLIEYHIPSLSLSNHINSMVTVYIHKHIRSPVNPSSEFNQLYMIPGRRVYSFNLFINKTIDFT